MDINDIKVEYYFSLKEFECPCCKHVMLHPDLLDKLVKLRHAYGEPLIINSGYRCISYNKKVGGVPGSYHLFGMAADIYIRGIIPKDLAIQADLVGFSGIGLYNTFIHVDVRPLKERWDYRS